MTRHGSASLREEEPHVTETTQINTTEDLSDREKIEALAGIICSVGNEPAAALFVLMGTLQNSAEPEALAHVAAI